ncbi:MAG: malic enzyme-like NAD(P)-binding protein [Bacillota bacterium]
MTLRDRALALHAENCGKIEVCSKVSLANRETLALAYTPGVAEACREIANDPGQVFTYTARGNLVAVISDGSAVLGLGNIGPKAALPVMEGKAILFKSFAGVDAFPVCVATQSTEEIVRLVRQLEPTFGGINLEDISAPRCFEIEEQLRKILEIPVFHDDQHGTAVVTAAAVINALKVVNKRLDDTTAVINGAGAAGIATAELLLSMGIGDIILCDSRGAIFRGRTTGMNRYKEEIAVRTNMRQVSGSLADALEGADLFIGVSVARAITPEMVQRMNRRPVILAMANPVPEIMPDQAAAAGAAVIGTGRSDFPNQVNNVLAFPGILRGALDTRAREINEEMKLAAAWAIAGLINAEELGPDYIIPDAYDRRVAPAVAAAVAEAAVRTGVARVAMSGEEVARRTRQLVERANSGSSGRI